MSLPETTGADRAVRSPDLDTDAVKVAVVIATYRRPTMLADTLASVATQRTTLPFAVVVVENDAIRRDGFAVASDWLSRGSLPGLAIVEPQQGNVHAINAGFACALKVFPNADSILMIDDDERASPDWLSLMVSAAERGDSDVVGGPVVPQFRAGAPALLAHHPVFWPSHDVTGPVPMIYGTGNCLIRRRVFDRMGPRPLDPRFNFLGGGDLDFFTRCRNAGLKSFWVQEALITETVPEERARYGWVLRRGMRIGSINRAVEAKQAADRPARVRIFAKDLAIIPIALVRAMVTLVRTGNPMVATHPLAVSAGRIGAWFGVEQQPYRAGRTT